MIRIGHGFDVHAFGPGDFVVLGGVKIPYERGVVAHSDGDVVLHALCDALLGAAGLGDIGEHFPDSDAALQGVNSAELLGQCLAEVARHGYQFGNADITLVAQQPKVQAHKPAMREAIARLLNCPESAVNIKATTTEKLGYLGRAEGLAAHAVVLLTSK